jgi:hypothetical protein
VAVASNEEENYLAIWSPPGYTWLITLDQFESLMQLGLLFMALITLICLGFNFLLIFMITQP